MRAGIEDLLIGKPQIFGPRRAPVPAELIRCRDCGGRTRLIKYLMFMKIPAAVCRPEKSARGEISGAASYPNRAQRTPW